jgi:N6-L-threonylcarbamoyladenine synthase
VIVLGIETSCDETACAVVKDDKTILAHLVRAQLTEHQVFGGVVPEVAARSHLHALYPLVQECLSLAAIAPQEIDAIAATTGPGLIGGVMVGASFAKGLALGLGKPFLAINHLEAHALTPRLTHEVPFPYMLLLVSGGHCQILIAHGVGHYTQLGSTMDDAVGEAFDKTAKLLGLGYPGGPALEERALAGNANRFVLPKPLIHTPGCDFSFSGLKTAVRQLIERLTPMTEQDVADVCASFQKTVAHVFVSRLKKAFAMATLQGVPFKHLVMAGGVAANKYVGAAVRQLADDQGLTFVAPPLSLCTDNGAMIAWAGIERLRCGAVDELDTPCRPRWPLRDLMPCGGLV